MIEASENFEIDIDELMQRIREEVNQRKNISNSEKTASIRLDTAKGGIDTSNIEALLNNAEFKSQVRNHWPEKLDRFPFNLFKKITLKIYNFLLKEQRAVNFSLIQALRESLALNRHLSEQVNLIQTQLNTISDRVSSTEQGVHQLSDRVSSTEQGVHQLSDRVSSTEQGVHQLSDRLSATEKAISDRVSSTEQGVHQLSDRLSATEQGVHQVSDRLHTNEQQLIAVDERYLKNDHYLKNDLTQQKRLITLFLEEARQRLPEPFNQDQLQSFILEERHLLDAFYVAFEDNFRGSREDINNRLKVYLPLIEEAKIGTGSSPILDVGCGRGEWLELLRESGYIAKGIDINRVMIEECQSRGLDVTQSDVIAYLRSLPDASLGAVVGFHIIEHLPFEVLIKLFDETIRVLQPGGITIFETPNPDNVLVGSNTFYTDPTHRNPLPSNMVQFLAEWRGLYNVKIINLHPYTEEIKLKGSAIAERFNEYFYGAQDYAVTGYKHG
ncbi:MULTISPECIES: class I SAM-dependent methyltransferase [Cyanophyceae]|uniref:class I SAM-dependent methyltransferase n=1 Tax=Cyanophyceae TaxID=3028117 RepID=UPI0016855D1E|nr:class I SAM-dependent methyltransferase [Trichocoleus sp. FACHB-40]MBD2004105.1 methyltransferase domain-containing protein [Trichocoleus sp. FACHB-40]